eukprot:6254881-Prymnesium_polylepis.1
MLQKALTASQLGRDGSRPPSKQPFHGSTTLADGQSTTPAPLQVDVHSPTRVSRRIDLMMRGAFVRTPTRASKPSKAKPSEKAQPLSNRKFSYAEDHRNHKDNPWAALASARETAAATKIGAVYRARSMKRSFNQLFPKGASATSM